MSDSESLPVVIRGVKVLVPVYRDKETTHEIATRVDAHVQGIESGAKRVDSHAFALRAAYDFAVRHDLAEREHEREQREMSSILGELESLINRLSRIE
jgi:hypothetical protein